MCWFNKKIVKQANKYCEMNNSMIVLVMKLIWQKLICHFYKSVFPVHNTPTVSIQRSHMYSVINIYSVMNMFTMKSNMHTYIHSVQVHSTQPGFTMTPIRLTSMHAAPLYTMHAHAGPSYPSYRCHGKMGTPPNCEPPP